jgi:hypothetical protein
MILQQAPAVRLRGEPSLLGLCRLGPNPAAAPTASQLWAVGGSSDGRGLCRLATGLRGPVRHKHLTWGCQPRRATAVVRAAANASQGTGVASHPSAGQTAEAALGLDSGHANTTASTGSAGPTPAPPSPSSGPSAALIVAGVIAAGAIIFSLGRKKDSPAAVRSSIAQVTSPSGKRGQGNGAMSDVGAATEAAPAALASMAKHFPNAVEQKAFVRACAKELADFGFTRDNCIALVNTCRDEICRPLVGHIDEQFGMSFNISGLGGLINCGKTGLKAGFSHSPVFKSSGQDHPRERYVFFAFPHVSVGETGEVGSILRRGRGTPSSACGALIAIQKDSQNRAESADDPDDVEYVTLKKKVLSQPLCKNREGGGLTLVDVTMAALQQITDDLENLISKTVDVQTADYALITGVQIHSGNQIPGQPFRLDRTVDYVAPGTMYTVVRGQKQILTVDRLKAAGPFSPTGKVLVS